MNTFVDVSEQSWGEDNMKTVSFKQIGTTEAVALVVESHVSAPYLHWEIQATRKNYCSKRLGILKMNVNNKNMTISKHSTEAK